MAATYIVFCMMEGDKPSLKVFSQRPDARSYAKAQITSGADTADIYEIDGVTDASGSNLTLDARV